MFTLSEIIKSSRLGHVRHYDMAPVLTEYVARFQRSRGLIYVGANTGDELPLCKSLADRVYAFEPIPTDSVWSHLTKHQDHKTQCYNYALSDSAGEFDMYPASNNYQSSSLFRPGTHINEFGYVSFNDPVKIQTRRLDSFDFASSCDTVIMDVQGAELKVLNGITNFSNFRLFILEFISYDMYQGACTFDDLLARLQPLGFEYWESFGIYYNPQTQVFAGNAVFLKE